MGIARKLQEYPATDPDLRALLTAAATKIGRLTTSVALAADGLERPHAMSDYHRKRLIVRLRDHVNAETE